MTFNYRNKLVDLLKGSSNLQKRVTSLQEPYKIVDIAHISTKTNGMGKLLISASPGKKDCRWNRDLCIDLDVIKNSGIQIIVCLLEWSEMKKLSIADYPKKCQEKGLLFYHLPIKDFSAPRQKEVDTLVPLLVEHLVEGKNILVHCRAGLGRAGTICACCLCHFGFKGKEAIELVRNQRNGAIQTSNQENCVINYYDRLLEWSKQELSPY